VHNCNYYTKAIHYESLAVGYACGQGFSDAIIPSTIQ